MTRCGFITRSYTCRGRDVAISIPVNVRALLEAPNYVHLSTLRVDRTPRAIGWLIGVEGELVCTSKTICKAKDMRRDSRVALSVHGES